MQEVATQQKSQRHHTFTPFGTNLHSLHYSMLLSAMVLTMTQTQKKERKNASYVRTNVLLFKGSLQIRIDGNIPSRV